MAIDLDRDFSLGWGIQPLKYYSSPLHAMIGVENSANHASLDNIGLHGENLTIAVLSMNRADVTLRLLDSILEHIPDFAGEFLIGDNGSDEDQRAILRQRLSEMPFACRLLPFDRNYGVAGGRNRTFSEVRTDWLLSSDNDMYFIGNPLPKIQADIRQLGCHFLNVPILNKEKHDAFLYGGHLYIDNLNSRVGVGGGSVLISPHVEANVPHEPFLCSFVAGGACVMNRNTFLQCGGYEERMFVGFEDTEFSVRVFQKGYKIGTLGIASMIHDHQKPQKKADAHYENQRFSVDYLKESAKVFEDKHGFAVWNPSVTKWLDSRRKELLNGTGVDAGNVYEGQKPRVALIVDAHNWALDHIAAQVVKNLEPYYEFKLIYQSEVDNLASILMLAEECQIIHFLWRPLASSFYSEWAKYQMNAIGMSTEQFYDRYVKGKVISVAVYDHLLLEGPDAHFTQELFSDPKSIVTSYTVSSERLKKLYDEMPEIRMKPAHITADGVDTTMFQPERLERFEDISNRTVRIGWVGNSKWAVNDLKGINTIIRPAVERLQQEGYQIELITSDRNNKLIPHEKMPAFYHDIDVYVCASLCEGTPNPVLEAMACGVPVVSTDVGLIPELFGPLQKEYVLEERSVDCLVAKLKQLLADPRNFTRLSEENLRQIQDWDWQIKTLAFKEYFDACMRKIRAGE